MTVIITVQLLRFWMEKWLPNPKSLVNSGRMSVSLWGSGDVGSHVSEPSKMGHVGWTPGDPCRHPLHGRGSFQRSQPSTVKPVCARFSHSAMSNSVTPWTASHQAPLSTGTPGKNTGVGCHFLPQGIVQARDQAQVSRSQAASLPTEPAGRPKWNLHDPVSLLPLCGLKNNKSLPSFYYTTNLFLYPTWENRKTPAINLPKFSKYAHASTWGVRPTGPGWEHQERGASAQKRLFWRSRGSTVTVEMTAFLADTSKCWAKSMFIKSMVTWSHGRAKSHTLKKPVWP